MMLFRRNYVVFLSFVLCSAFAAPESRACSGSAQTARASIQASASPIRDGFITTSDGARIHFRAAGQITAAPSIVFIPGWTLTASLWDQQLRVFSATRLAIAVDSRSQGESSIVLSGNTPERRAVDLHELIASLHISRFVIVGWSQGAQDVAAYIQEFGTDSLAAVVFVDSPVSYGPAEVDVHKEFSKIILSRLALYDSEPAEYSANLSRSIFHLPHPDLDLQHVVDESKKTPSSIGMAMLVMDIFGVDRRPALKKIDRPTLVIASADSPLLDVEKEMADAIPGARWVVVQDAGHAVFIDQPEKFDAEMTRLLERITP
jgi:non-heme chloroperoxidase